MKKHGLQRQKLKQQAKLLCKSSGGEIDSLMYSSLEEKMRKGGDAQRITSNAKGEEYYQEYKMGCWTHSGPKKKK
mgnify:CR=1 FL=1